jgi:hypothetical protein
MLMKYADSSGCSSARCASTSSSASYMACPICAYRTAVFRRTVLDGSGLRLLPY